MIPLVISLKVCFRVSLKVPWKNTSLFSSHRVLFLEIFRSTILAKIFEVFHQGFLQKYIPLRISFQDLFQGSFRYYFCKFLQIFPKIASKFHLDILLGFFYESSFKNFSGEVPTSFFRFISKNSFKNVPIIYLRLFKTYSSKGILQVNIFDSNNAQDFQQEFIREYQGFFLRFFPDTPLPGVTQKFSSGSLL